jgi:hypothetical protein
LGQMAVRSRCFGGSDEELQCVIAPFVTSEHFLLYQEKPSDPVIPDTLTAHKYMLRALTDVCPNLSFGKRQLEAVFTQILEVKKFQSLDLPGLKEDWVKTTTRRLQMACRHVSQARVRPTPPKWLAIIDDGDSFPMTTQLTHDDTAGSEATGSEGPDPAQVESEQRDAGEEPAAATEDAQRREDPIRITDNMHIIAKSIAYSIHMGQGMRWFRAEHCTI